MARLSKHRRSGRGSAGLDRVALRALIKDLLAEVVSGGAVGVVRVPLGDATHYRVVDGDILVEVEIMPHGERVSARLGALIGGPTKGVWAIPDPETEVVVAFQGGEFEADPYIVSVLASGQAPSGLVPGKVIVIGTEVLVHDGAGAAPLATKADMDALRTYINATMVLPVATTCPAGAGTGTAGPIPSPLAPAPVGTTILKGK